MDSLNDLIGMAQSLLNTGFDVDSFLTWKSMAFWVLLGLLGPFHYYTRNFTRFTAEADKRGLLAGEGLLLAAKEQILTSSRSEDESELTPAPGPADADDASMDQGKKWYPLSAVQQAHRR